jgi:hypothetical protein
VVACFLAGVVLVSSGFAVVSGAKVAKPGGVCGRAGDRFFSQSVSLVCKKMVSGKLVWRVVKASTTSTTTTTTVALTTASALKVAVVAPRVVSATPTATTTTTTTPAPGNAVITIADMSPDTGVYAVQWVLAGQDFNSYQMYRSTSKTMTVPSLSCGRTYTLRVFVMKENWQMSDGFVNQNVTPHSATFDLTMPACTAAAAATTTTVALTCAQGGTCAVGDTGPGGGEVFYVHDDADDFFTSTGSDCGTECRGLEAAPTTGANSWTDAKYAWSGNTSTLIGSTLEAIGAGYANTEAMVTQSSGGSTENMAGTIARAYRGPNNKTDWHLPSVLELNQLCRYVWKLTVNNSATTCTDGQTGTIRFVVDGRAGFLAAEYWTSTEFGTGFRATKQSFLTGGRQIYCDKINSTKCYVRPVRAFG